VRRVLSIDGGGIKGAFAAAFLDGLQARLAHPLWAYFDLIAGTSTGGIIALGIGAGLKTSQILRFYDQYGPAIFVRQGILARIAHYLSGKHEAGPLRFALEHVFEAKRLGESRVRLTIPSQNLETGEVHIFKTAHHERFATDYKELMVDVALATSAAPSYFPTHLLPLGTPLIDGGLWANNPSAVAAVEAVSILGWRPGDVFLLSLSCTRAPLTAQRAIAVSAGKAYWAPKLVEVMSAGQSSGALGAASHLLGREHVYRVEPVVSAGAFALDQVGAIERLKGLGASEARKHVPQLLPHFAAIAEPFEPHYRPGQRPG
jgi:hypothetical protein